MFEGTDSIPCQMQKVYTTGYWESTLHFHSYIILLLILFKLIFHYWLLITLFAKAASFCKQLQNRAARIVTNSSFDSRSNPLIKKLGLKIINDLIDIESKTMVFKSLNGLAPPYLRRLYRKNSQSTSYSLRSTSTDLGLLNKSREYGKKSFLFRGAKLWNSLKANCKQAAFLSTFKRHIQQSKSTLNF